jgi:phosphoribosyl 1,2-cyclic phosphodiesterase
MHAILLGNRGSRPLGASEESPFARYGGDTTSILVACDDKTFIALDAGSGFWKMPFTMEKITGEKGNYNVQIFLSHYHDDHVMGLAQSDLLFNPTNSMTIHGPDFTDTDLKTVFNAKANKPFNPDLEQFYQANIELETLKPLKGEKRISESTTISWLAVPHGVEQSLAFRIDSDGKSLSCISDTNHALESDNATPVLCADIIDFIRDSDALIYDCHFSDKEILSNPGFYLGMGHSSGEHGVRLCEAANIPVLVTHHHNPNNTDDKLDSITKKFKACGKKHGVKVIAAQPSLPLDLGLSPKKLMRDVKSMSTAPERWAKIEAIMRP